MSVFRSRAERRERTRRARAFSFAEHLTGEERLPYTLAVHRGGQDGGNPHAHLMISERANDGIERSREQWFKRYNASVVTSKPANGGHRKTGQWGWPGTVLFYPFEPVPGKPVLVRQLRGPHLRT